MGQCCGCYNVDFSGLEIETSFRVRRDPVFAFPCGSTTKYVIRDADRYGKFDQLDSLFDDIDRILSSTKLTPLIYLLIGVIGGLGTGLMVYFDQMTYIWMVWVLPQCCFIQPLHFYFHGCRYRRLEKVLTDWYRNHGARQGVQVHLGIDDAIQYRWFANAIGNWSWCNSTGVGCRCCRFEPQIHVCKPKSGETFPTF